MVIYVRLVWILCLMKSNTKFWKLVKLDHNLSRDEVHYIAIHQRLRKQIMDWKEYLGADLWSGHNLIMINSRLSMKSSATCMLFAWAAELAWVHRKARNTQWNIENLTACAEKEIFLGNITRFLNRKIEQKYRQEKEHT